MSFWIRLLFVLLLVAALSGCTQSDQDDEKEPHYVLGISRVNAMDYQGAVEAFEESLEANPHSAPAHYQLGMLYENQQSDPAGAIYHYEQYLKFNPSAENADIIRQHIAACKQQLAADVLPLPSAPQAQQQLEKLVEQNRQLQQQVQSLQDTLKQWNMWYANQSTAKTNAPLPQDESLSSQPGDIGSSSPPDKPVEPVHPTRVVPAAPARTQNPVAHGHTHVVERGETAMAICRKFGVHLNELASANPALNLSKLRPGEVLNIP
ncbi:MAG TPA: LysM peptidoglycan-binding domain-containing protein [Verrucomicrobiae bacterium]|jgi:tetratricopeptide (TPR) repeat protein|nr:LysM peptidoglycan-binding domain-containing protein [Verrucomicrobiae bacterium]